jgi:hypothetical protein
MPPHPPAEGCISSASIEEWLLRDLLSEADLQFVGSFNALTYDSVQTSLPRQNDEPVVETLLRPGRSPFLKPATRITMNFHSAVVPLLGIALLYCSGCVNYESSYSSRERVLSDNPKVRQIKSEAMGDSYARLRVTARDHWEQEIEFSKVPNGEYAFDSFFQDAVLEEDGLDCFFWFLTVGWLALPADVIAVVLTGPIAIIRHMFSGGDQRENGRRKRSAAVPKLELTTRCGSWQATTMTDAKGEAKFDLRIPASAALARGEALAYQVELKGTPDIKARLTLDETLACSEPSSRSEQERRSKWQRISSRFPTNIQNAIKLRLERQRKTALAKAKSDAARVVARRKAAAGQAEKNRLAAREQQMRGCACVGTGLHVVGNVQRYGVGHRLVPQTVYIVSGRTSMPYSDGSVLAVKKVRFRPNPCPRCNGRNRVSNPPPWDHH